ncbi:RND efflux system, outer membrane lipoprotein, NodT family [Mycolicibacterium rhodesiae JS60]|nr:RND efflux system, outer membrane lipoprotein, NodT family [Mycolicibacterium rhodesiae JS60]
MTTGVDDLTSPAGALNAAQDAYREAASCSDDPQRRAQYARTAQDYAATTYWHPESTPRQRQQAQECMRQSYDLDAGTKARHTRLRASLTGAHAHSA